MINYSNPFCLLTTQFQKQKAIQLCGVAIYGKESEAVLQKTLSTAPVQCAMSISDTFWKKRSQNIYGHQKSGRRANCAIKKMATVVELRRDKMKICSLYNVYSSSNFFRKLLHRIISNKTT